MKIKIVNVISDSNLGGAGVLLLNNLRRADRAAFEYVVVLPCGSVLRALAEGLGVRVVEMAGIAERSFSLSAVWPLARLFKAEGADLVHAHGSLSARIAGKMAGCKVVYTRHCAFDLPAWQTSRVGRLLLFANNSLADGIIAVSPAARDNLLDMGVDPKKITVVFNGTEPISPLNGLEKAEARVRFGVDKGEVVFTIAARLTPVKGHATIIEAARLLRDLKGFRVLIAGAGELEDELKKIAKDLTNVNFLGFVADTRALHGITDVALNASYGTETTSLALLEPMSLGVPAIVSDFGGNPYVIENGENGLVFPKKDADRLAECMRRLVGDASLRRKLSDGATKNFSRFTAERMSRENEAVYRSVLKH